MAITVTTDATGATFDLGGGLGTWDAHVADDAGTERIILKYNGQKVGDVTPSGGHVEDRGSAPYPSGYEVT